MKMLLEILSAFFVIFSYFDFVCGMIKGPLNAMNHFNGSKVQAKIVGGEPVAIESYPFAVQFINMGSLCGGVIINSWSVLTAAHCVEFNTDMDQMMIQVGAKYTYDFNAARHRVVSFKIHEDYNKKQPFSSDIALVFLKKPIQLGTTAKKGILVNHDKWMDEREKTFIVTGWGFTKQEGEVSKVGLQSARLRYVAPKDCSRRLDSYKLSEDMFCLYGDGQRDTCQGDSGGGVLWNDMLVGLTSHGHGCANEGKPSVYTNLWVLRTWIHKSIEHFLEQYCNHRFRHDAI